MGAIGDMQKYMQYQMALGVRDAASAEGGGGLAGAGVGLGAGVGMGSAMAQMMSQMAGGGGAPGAAAAAATPEIMTLSEAAGYMRVGEEDVLEVIKAFESSTGQKLNYKIVDRRAGDIEQVWADTTIANNELGWKAELDLETMMSSAWRWQQRLIEES